MNTAAIIRSIGIRGGFSNTEEFFSALNVPFMSLNTYTKQHEFVSNTWEKCALNEMKHSVEAEKELAKQRGDVDSGWLKIYGTGSSWDILRQTKGEYTARHNQKIILT